MTDNWKIGNEAGLWYINRISAFVDSNEALQGHQGAPLSGEHTLTFPNQFFPYLITEWTTLLAYLGFQSPTHIDPRCSLPLDDDYYRPSPLKGRNGTCLSDPRRSSSGFLCPPEVLTQLTI